MRPRGWPSSPSSCVLRAAKNRRISDSSASTSSGAGMSPPTSARPAQASASNVRGSPTASNHRASARMLSGCRQYATYPSADS